MSESHLENSPAPSAAPQIFRVNLARRVLLGGFLGGLALFLLSVPFWATTNSSDTLLLFALMLVIASILFLTLLVVFRTRLEILPDRVRLRGAFRSKELAIANIDGFRITKLQHSSNLVLHAKTPPPKTITIDLGVTRKDELLRWVTQNFPDLDVVEHEVEVEEIRADTTLGASEEQRLAALARAQKFTKALHGLTVATVLWALFFPRPYVWSISALAIVPFVALVLLRVFRGLVVADGKPTGARPNVAYALFAPSVVLALRALLDWHVLEWKNFWGSWLLLAVVLASVLAFACAEIRKKPGKLALMAVFFLAYAYGLVVHVNCYHDRTPPKVFGATVVSRRISNGKTTDYYLTVHPWIDGSDKEEVSVDEDVYASHAEGSLARIFIREGKLGIPWYFVH